MRKRKILLSSICMLLLVVVATSFAREDVELMISENRDAVVKIIDKTGDDEVEGKVMAASDLKSGKSSLEANLKLLDNPELTGAKAGAYATMTADQLEFVGDLNIQIPPEGDAPEILDIDFETVTEGDTSSGKLTAKLVAPAKDDEIPNLKFAGDAKGSFKEFTGNMTYDVAAPDMPPVPVNSVELTIKDEADITSLKLTIKAPKGSDVANQLAMMSGFKPMLQQQISGAGFQVEKLEIPAPVDENDLSVATVDLGIKDFRGTLSTMINGFAPNMAMPGVSGSDMAAALNEMLAVKSNNFEFKMHFDAGKVDGSMAMNLTDLDKFFKGYLRIFPALAEMQKATRDFSEGGEFQQFIDALAAVKCEAVRRGVESDGGVGHDL